MDYKIKKIMEQGYSERGAIVFTRANGKCEYCHIDLISERLAFDCVQFDHIIPKSQGGEDMHENLAFSCQTCNTAKNVFIPEGRSRDEFIESAKVHIKNKREHANKFWETIKNILRK